jgi:hypothetical protein
LIGRFTAGEARCLGRAVATLLFGTGLWQIYKLSKTEEKILGYILHWQILIRAPERFIGCLVDALVAFEYNEAGGGMTLIGTRMPVLLPLGILMCPMENAFVGRINLLETPERQRIRIILRDR